jgi:hypothetical protein
VDVDALDHAAEPLGQDHSRFLGIDGIATKAKLFG